MPYTRFEQIFFNYFEQFKRLQEATPLVLGGVSGAGGGTGGRPGGFVGYLPQTNVAYDMTEAESLYVPDSGASLLDNLNHIRYRLANVEGISAGLAVYEDGIEIASGVTILDFLMGNITETSPGHITVESDITFLDLTDTPDTYAGQSNKYITVKGDATGVEFTTLVPSGDSFKAKVSSNDTTEDFLQSKLTAGNNVTITVLNEGGNEQLQVSVPSGTMDHGTLLGLADDDHTQYLNNARHDLTLRHTLGTIVPHDSLDGLSNVSILSPVEGESLVYDGANWVNATTSGGSASAIRTFTFGQPGTLSVKTLEARLFAPFPGVITNVVSTVNTPPQGQSIILDIYKNGATIYGTNPANRPTISGGSYNDMDSVPDTTGFTTNDLFTALIIQTGTTTSGADLVMQIRCTT